MNNETRNILDVLNEEQQRIIDSQDRKIIVSAGPGSGKTHTIIRKIIKDLYDLPEYRGVIACSFTREASRQLKTKLEKDTDIKSSFVGTIDSFIFSVIIDPFKNRYLDSIHMRPIESLRVVFPLVDSEANYLTKVGIGENTKADLTRYCNDWLVNFSKGIYELSFPSYWLASKMILGIEAVKNYIEDKFESLYIDEAQDLNEFQHMFLDVILSKCNIKCVLIGDKNQSIYQFRGARPALFYKQIEKGFTEFSISVSMRCHKSILDYSNLLVNPIHHFQKNAEVRVLIDIKPECTIFDRFQGNFFVLCETNSEARSMYSRLSTIQNNFIYSQPIFFSNKSFHDEYIEYIEEIMKFYLNFLNSVPSLTYSIEDFKVFLSNFIDIMNIKDSKLDPASRTMSEYLFYIFELLGVSIDSEIKREIIEKFQDNVYTNHYVNYLSINRIMTIHASKGLEADNVFIVLSNFRKLDDEYTRKLFVGFTRAKKYLLISYADQTRIQGSSLDSILRENLTRL